MQLNSRCGEIDDELNKKFIIGKRRRKHISVVVLYINRDTTIQFLQNKNFARLARCAIGDARHGDGTSEPDKQICNGSTFIRLEIIHRLLFTPTVAISFTVVTFRQPSATRFSAKYLSPLCFFYLFWSLNRSRQRSLKIILDVYSISFIKVLQSSYYNVTSFSGKKCSSALCDAVVTKFSIN